MLATFTCWSLTPQGVYIWRQHFKEVIEIKWGHKDITDPWYNGTVYVFTEERPGKDTQQEGCCLQARKKGLTKHRGYLDLRLLDSGVVRKQISVVNTTRLWYFVVVAEENKSIHFPNYKISILSRGRLETLRNRTLFISMTEIRQLLNYLTKIWHSLDFHVCYILCTQFSSAQESVLHEIWLYIKFNLTSLLGENLVVSVSSPSTFVVAISFPSGWFLSPVGWLTECLGIWLGESVILS